MYKYIHSPFINSRICRLLFSTELIVIYKPGQLEADMPQGNYLRSFNEREKLDTKSL